MQACRRDDRYPAGGQGPPQRRERRAVVDLDRQREQILAVGFRQTLEARHRPAG